MALRILTNTASLGAQRELDIAQRALYQTLEKLSSGKRINHSWQDAAGFLLGIQMGYQITGVQAGTNNLTMAVDLLNTADSFTRAIDADMNRMVELAYQAKNNLLTAQQRSALDNEFQELITEIQRLATNAVYNGRTLLDGSLIAVTVQTGYSASDFVQVSIDNMSTGALGLAGLGVTTVALAQTAISTINSTVRNIFGPAVARIGAQAASWLKSIDAQDAYAQNLTAARSRITDADIAAETTNLTNYQVIVQSGIAALAQANAAQTLALGLIGGG